MHVMFSLKPGDHESLTLFIHGPLLKRTLLIVLPAVLIQIPICPSRVQFLSAAEASPGIPGAAWQLLAGC